MSNKKTPPTVEEEFDVEELAMQLADMLHVALYFAGVKKENLEKAVDAYLDGMDESLGEEDGEMGFEEVIKVITDLQKNKPELFK